MTIYLATTNVGKQRDFALAASAHSIFLLPLPGIETMPTPEEDAATFAGNADLKSRAYSRLAPERYVLADDSGLEVSALGGRPGVLSARFADSLNFLSSSGLGKDERNNACVLSLMHELERDLQDRVPRGARFVCALSVARNGEVLLRAEGTVEGDLIDTPRGSNGFGYDPLFLLRSRGLTLAELPRDEKWITSHRGAAFRDLLEQMRATKGTFDI